MRKCWACQKEWEDDHVTICLICGAGTREHKPEAKPVEVKHGDRVRHREQPTESR